MRKTIFVVDDSNTNLAKAEECLEELYNVITIPSGIQMFKKLDRIRPDLILLDIEMPEMNGFEALKKLKSNKLYDTIPVIFLTARSDVETETRGFEMGVVDFISKPFSAPVLLNRIKCQIDINEIILKRTAALENTQRNMMFVLADLVESRDEGTGGHIDRTTKYVRILTEAMIEQGVYVDDLGEWDLDVLAVCAALHDVGKIGVSDLILNKPDKLSREEYTKMQSHAINGALIISRVIERTGEDKFLQTAKLFAEFHHECWDGSGYPHGLKNYEIPLQGRIMAIADVYDALVSERPYKVAFSDEAAVDIISQDSGVKFDPAIVDVFLSIKEKFKETRLNQIIDEKVRKHADYI